jgi:DNA polymerase-3 subunit epsilon
MLYYGLFNIFIVIFTTYSSKKEIDMERFICIDVETASRYERGSLCQIAIVEYNDGNINTLFSSLVNPQCAFDPFLCNIHGISPKDVQNAPTFSVIWDEIKPILTSAPIIAHNAIFDISVLERALYINDIEPVELFYTCSLMGSHGVLWNLSSYKLSSICNSLGIKYTNHHDAEADAIACCNLTLILCEKVGATSLEELAWRCGNELCSSFTNNYDPENKIRSCPSQIVTAQESIKLMPQLDIDLDSRDYLKDKVIVFTGLFYSMIRQDAIQKAERAGAIYKNNRITKKTNLLSIGCQDMTSPKASTMSKKQQIAIEYRERGLPIEWIDEGEFLRLISL